MKCLLALPLFLPPSLPPLLPPWTGQAHEVYLRTAIGNAPWPIGITMVGIHERTGREKISSSKVGREGEREGGGRRWRGRDDLLTVTGEDRKEIEGYGGCPLLVYVLKVPPSLYGMGSSSMTMPAGMPCHLVSWVFLYSVCWEFYSQLDAWDVSRHALRWRTS